MRDEPLLRKATLGDLDDLVRLEEKCFSSDRMSRRRFRHWIQAPNAAFTIAEVDGRSAGYSLIFFLRGTTLARLYSIAIDPDFRGSGIAKRLMIHGEEQVEESGRLFLRLEVSVENTAAIRLYSAMGYQHFGIYRNYYEDNNDALRMQKCIRTVPQTAANRALHWIQQTTPFTCGPAALMMAMRGLSRDYKPTQGEEIQIWREATTIFMTSGHGGCHPVGLALAAHLRGFGVEVWLNQTTPLFLDSVRDENKKRVIELVDQDFLARAKGAKIRLSYREFSDRDLVKAYDKGYIPLILISTYRLDGRKAPHWVVMSGYDDDCLYVHDSDPDPEEQSASGFDSQHLPIARGDFVKMSRFGRSQLRTAVIVKPPPAGQ